MENKVEWKPINIQKVKKYASLKTLKKSGRISWKLFYKFFLFCAVDCSSLIKLLSSVLKYKSLNIRIIAHRIKAVH